MSENNSSPKDYKFLYTFIPWVAICAIAVGGSSYSEWGWIGGNIGGMIGLIVGALIYLTGMHGP